jgi:2,3-bisphosphoglycerate-independent phosphoglycerate mutase
MTAHRAPLVLLVLDGWGLSREREYNAIALARTPTFDELVERFRTTSLEASGERVGLPRGQMGNSEVGHMNMGAGRVVYQDLTRIDKAIETHEFFSNEAVAAAMDRCTAQGRALHLIGLVSDGGVHSSQAHLHALIAMAAKRGVKNLFVHAFTDGRDTSPTGGVRYLSQLRDFMNASRLGRLASVAGRYYAMDRDNRWERTQRAYDVMTATSAARATDAFALLQSSYANGVTDEFIEPHVLVDAASNPIGAIRDDDSVICFNFRADRVRQMTRVLAFADFKEFERTVHPSIAYTCMTEYSAAYNLPVAFPPQTLSENLGEVLGRSGLTNLRLAETEKYAHVTYFFNCGEERPYGGEERLLIPSPKVPTYDLQPEMSAPGITAALLADLEARRHDVVICNFANADMVGHTGKLDATIRAVETLDGCLGRIVPAVRARGGTVLITADHGNCEQMWDAALESPHTAHTSNPVPLLLVGEDDNRPLRAGGALCDVAPTILALLGLQQPREMTGRDLRVD